MKKEKKYYYVPEVRFHQLKTAAMIAHSGQEEVPVEEGGELSKGFGSFSLDEDED